MANGIDHGTLVDWVNEADDATVDSRKSSEKCRDYYDSKQWSEAEAKALAKRKQAATVINRIKPKIDGLAGMERTNRTTARAYPRTPKHDKDATGATEAIRFVLQDNFYNQLRSQAWDSLCVEGTGGLDVIVNKETMKIEINHIMWDRILYDPHSRRKDFSDARYLGQVVWLDYDQALEQYPGSKDVLESMIDGSETYDDRPRWMDQKRKRVKIVEMYYMQDGDWWYACFTRGGYCEKPQVSPYKNEEGITEHPYEFGSLFVDRDGSRYGACLQYLDVQDEINKRRSKALHLMSVRQVMLERGAVEDVNKARQELARPDGVVEVTPGMVFEVLKTGDMAAAQFNLLQEAKNEVDAVGYNAAASGKEQKSMSGIALENRRLAGQTEIAPMFDVLRHMDVRIYRKIWNRIKQYWREEKWIRVTDDPHNLRWVGLNAKDPKTGQKVNDIAALDVDIVIDDAPDSVTMQAEEFTALSEMVKSGIPVPPDAIIEASNLKNKDKILQRMRGQLEIPPQVKEQIQQMQEEMQKMGQENQQLKAGAQVQAMKIQADAQANQQKSAASREEALAELALKREIQAEELKLEREKAEAQIALERAKAIAQIEVERMKIAFNADAECDSAIAEVKNLSAMHETKMKGALDTAAAAKEAKEEGDDKKAEADAAAEMRSMHQEFMAAVTKILEKLDKKKNVRMTMPDGRTASAEVG